MSEQGLQEKKPSTQTPDTPSTNTETKDPLTDLLKGAESLVKRSYAKGKNEAKKDSKDPKAKKGYQIVDAVIRLDNDRREKATEEKKLKKALRDAEDNPEDYKTVELAMKMCFTKLSLLSEPVAQTSSNPKSD